MKEIIKMRRKIALVISVGLVAVAAWLLFVSVKLPTEINRESRDPGNQNSVEQSAVSSQNLGSK
jgi:hypothetical protein